MHFRKLISLWALLDLVLGQVALAQHKVTHIDHGASFELASAHNDKHDHNDHEHDDDQKNINENCQVCLLTNALVFAIVAETDDFSFTLTTSYNLSKNHGWLVNGNVHEPYNPRAPPTFLI